MPNGLPTLTVVPFTRDKVGVAGAAGTALKLLAVPSTDPLPAIGTNLTWKSCIVPAVMPVVNAALVCHAPHEPPLALLRYSVRQPVIGDTAVSVILVVVLLARRATGTGGLVTVIRVTGDQAPSVLTL